MVKTRQVHVRVVFLAKNDNRNAIFFHTASSNHYYNFNVYSNLHMFLYM